MWYNVNPLAEFYTFWIQSFSFPRLVAIPKLKHPNVPDYLPIYDGRIVGCIPYKHYVKCKQPCPGIELGSTCPFPTTITIALRAPLSLSLYIYIYIYTELGVLWDLTRTNSCRVILYRLSFGSLQVIRVNSVIKYGLVLLGLMASTIVDYLISNPVNTYILDIYMICKHIL